MLKMDYLIVLLPKPPVMSKTGRKCQLRRFGILGASRRHNEHTRSTSIHNKMMLRQFCCIGGFELTGGHPSVSAFFVYFGKWRKAVFVEHINRFICYLPQINVLNVTCFISVDFVHLSKPVVPSLLLCYSLVILTYLLSGELLNDQVVRPLSVK